MTPEWETVLNMFRAHAPITGELFILDENSSPVRASTLLEWVDWLENAGSGRLVARTEVGRFLVSTVFVGLVMAGRHRLLFETVAFDADDGWDCKRYSTWAQAELGHYRMVQRVKAHLETEEVNI